MTLNLLDRVTLKGVPRVVIGVRLTGRGTGGEYVPVYLTAPDHDYSDLGDGHWREAGKYDPIVQSAEADE